MEMEEHVLLHRVVPRAGDTGGCHFATGVCCLLKPAMGSKESWSRAMSSGANKEGKDS